LKHPYDIVRAEVGDSHGGVLKVAVAGFVLLLHSTTESQGDIEKTGSRSLASGPPSMRLLINFTVVPIVANIVVAPAAVTVASPPLSREPVNRTVLRTQETRSIVSEDDKSHEQKRDHADTKPDGQVSACQVESHRVHSKRI
jgi:hypothetical protein